jgi:hypothetical protein
MQMTDGNAIDIGERLPTETDIMKGRPSGGITAGDRDGAITMLQKPWNELSD